MKKLTLLIFILVLPLLLFSQNISVKNFRLLENDMSARIEHPKTDQNGETAALVKVVTTQTGFEFDGGSLGIVSVERKTGEYWVYVPRGAKAITIKHDKLGILRNYAFPVAIVAASVYELELVSGTVETIVKPNEIETQWLIVTTEPSGADIYINDQAAGQTPYQNEILVGKYSWRVSKELYLTDAGIAELTTETGKKKIDLKLKPNFGTISVKTTPEVNAQVFLNGMDVNKTTPCSLEKIPSGELTISAKTNYYAIAPQSVKMTPEQSLLVSLIASPTFGTISVSTAPESGAAVTLNGMPTGKITPCSLERIPAGEHSINISREWFETTTRKITLTAGQIQPVIVAMNPTFAEVSITTEPVADILINGQKKSNGTWKGRLTPGVYTFEAKLDKHTPAVHKQTVVVGPPLTVNLNPTPKTGAVKLISTPFDATITLNGKDYGTTPNTIKNLLVGDYTLIIKKAGYGTVTRTVTVKENATAEVNETLATGLEVTIASTPTGAQLTVDGVTAGATPYISILSFGSHTLKLRNGKKVVEESITVTQGGKTHFDYNMAEFGDFTETASGLNLWMVAIPGGTFQMGSPAKEVDRSDAETKHKVMISAFYMGQYEVTQAQWEAVMGSNPSSFNGCESCPVENVSWDDVQKFLRALNQKTGKCYRLPTEAEWEYAVRAGTTTPFSTGKNLTTAQANYEGSYPYNGNAAGDYRGKTVPVGSFAPNAFGLYEMHGNVWEWCSDWYGESYYGSSPTTNPQGPSSGTYRVLRGGSWSSNAGYCRSANRINCSSDSRAFNIGFRVVLSLQ